jgi:YD repeat-containing protein
MLRQCLMPICGLLTVSLSLFATTSGHAGMEPALYIYDCAYNQFAECRFFSPRTGPFEVCDTWGAAYVAKFNPAGCPCTFEEVPFSGPFGEQGKQCIISGTGGGLVARSIALPFCQTTPGYVLTGTDPQNLTCVGASTVPKRSRQSGPSKPCCANPINPAPSAGNKYEISLDYAGTGPFPLRLERYYNSAASQYYPGNRLQPFAFSTWRHSYERRIEFQVRGALSFARVDRPDGNSLYYTLNGTDWTSDPDVSERLEEVVEGGQTLWKFTSRADEIERYDRQTGNLLSITNRVGLTQTLAHDARNRVTSVTDPFGRTLTFTYNAANCIGGPCIASIEDPDGNVIQYGYDTVLVNDNPATRLRTVTYPGTPTPKTYNYDPVATKNLVEVIDENGNSTATWTYDGAARGTLSQHAGGADKVTLQYLNGSSVQVTYSISDGATPLNRVNIYQFQTFQGIQRNTSITGDPCPSCGAKTSQYDANGYLTKTTDWNDNVTSYLREDATRPELETQRVEAFGTPQARTITTEWHPTYRLPTRIAEAFRITTMMYGDPTDPNPGNHGSLLSRTIQATNDTNGSLGFGALPVGTRRGWTYTYNAIGQVLTMDGPRMDVSDVTTYTYYANDATCTGASPIGCRGQIQTITDAAGHVTQIIGYNAHGQPLSISDPNGLVTTLTYDARRRLTSRNVGGETTNYTYDNVGQLTRVTLPDGSFLTYTYDAAHRLTEIADNLGNRIIYTLDVIGNRTHEQVFDSLNQLAQTRSRVYSNLNRLAQEIGAAGQTTAFGYDDQGNLTSIDGPLAGTVDVTSNQYDALNRLIRMTDPLMGQVNYGYNGLDQLTSVSDPRSLTTSYSYDGLNNLNQLQSPDTGTTVNTYDAAGNLLTQTDAKGQLTTYTYDALNRVTRIVYQGGVTHSYQYDRGTNGVGRLTQITEPNSTTQYEYDQHGRVTSETRTINAVPYVTAYVFDSRGRMTGMTYPSGRTVTYTLDSLGRIQQIDTSKDGTTQTVVSGVAYRPFGSSQGFTFGNGQTYIRGFDQDGRIASYTLGNHSIAVGYDAASRIGFLSDVGNPANTTQYAYDNLDRLINAATPGTPYAYTYDAVGNRITKTVGAATETYSYGAASNRLTQIAGANNRTLAFDPNGSTVNDGLNQFVYDSRGRLIQSVGLVGTSSYQVNSLGQRIRKTNQQGDTIYHYDTQGRLIAESTPGGIAQKEYLYLGDIPVAVIQ